MPRLILSALLFAATPPVFADKAEPDDPKAPKAREIDLTGITPDGEGGAATPTKITKPEELEKHITGKEAREKILKQVNLKKEYLVVFRWAGSGGDRLSMSGEGDKVTFTKRGGLTLDYVQHLKVYALPAKATYAVAK